MKSFLVEDKDLFISKMLYHIYWWFGNSRRPGINTFDGFKSLLFHGNMVIVYLVTHLLHCCKQISEPICIFDENYYNMHCVAARKWMNWPQKSIVFETVFNWVRNSQADICGSIMSNCIGISNVCFKNYSYCAELFMFCVVLYLSLVSWWRHQMKTFYALLALCAGNSPVTGESPHRD